MKETLIEIQIFISEVTLIVLNIFVVCLYPVAFTILLPLLIHREFAKVLAKRDPKLGKILSGLTSQYAAHKTYTSPTAETLPYFIFSANIDKRHIETIFNKNIIERRDSAGKLVFPQMQQKIVRRYGYHFWETVEKFRIEDHVRYLTPENVVKKPEMQLIVQNLALLPFDPKLSPWEILLVPNLVDERDPSAKSAMILRVHHCLCDGYSILNIMRNLSTKPWEDFRGKAKIPETGHFMGLLTLLRVVFTGPYHFLKLTHFSNDNNKWAKSAMESGSGRHHLQISESIPLTELQSLKKRFGVNLSSVVIALMIGAVEKVMRKMKVTASRIHVTMPWPLPDRHCGLENRWTIVKLPVRIYRNELDKTLKYIDKQYKRLQYSDLPLVMLYTSKIIGNLPVSMIPDGDNVVSSTCVLTYFPLVSHEIDLFGYDVKFIGVGVTPESGFAIDTACLSYAGNLVYRGGAEASIFPEQEDADHFVKSVGGALNDLKLLAISTTYDLSKTTTFSNVKSNVSVSNLHKGD